MIINRRASLDRISSAYLLRLRINSLILLLKRLFSKQLLKILILAFQLLILSLKRGFLLYQKSYLFFQLLNVFTLLHPRADSRFSILQSFTSFFVRNWVFIKSIYPIFVKYFLFQILLFLFGEILKAFTLGIIVRLQRSFNLLGKLILSLFIKGLVGCSELVLTFSKWF